MELSSFQLMGVQEFHPEIAVITNLMPTHIDYHGSFEEYVAAKWNIQNKMTAADFLVLNFNQDLAKNWLAKHKPLLYHFQHRKRLMELIWKMVNSTSVEKWSWQRVKLVFQVATM